MVYSSDEWNNHPGAKFLEVEIRTGKTYFLTEQEVLDTWNVIKKELDAMDSISERDGKSIAGSVIGNAGWVLIKK